MNALFDDDLLPPVRPGRRTDRPFDRVQGQNPPKCRACPVWKRPTSVCLVRGCHQDPGDRACRYGADLIRKGGQ